MSDRLTESIYAIVCLHAAGHLSEGQATRLMNSGDRVSFRITRDKILRELQGLLDEDMKREGWKWTPDSLVQEEAAK